MYRKNPFEFNSVVKQNIIQTCKDIALVNQESDRLVVGSVSIDGEKDCVAEKRKIVDISSVATEPVVSIDSSVMENVGKVRNVRKRVL